MSSPDRFKPGLVTLLTAGLLATIFTVEVLLSADELTGLLSPSIQVLVATGGISKDAIFDRQEWWRLVAGPLLHGDLIHLVLNGVVLLFAGFLVESLVGKVRWITIYGVGAIAGGLLSALLNPPNIVSVGASGAGMALLASLFVLAFALESPSERTALQVNAARFLVPSLLPIATTRAAGHIDFAAHFGGALGGGLVALLLLPELKASLRAQPPSPEASLRFQPRLPLTATLAPIAAALVLFTLAGIVFTARDTPAWLVIQERAQPASWIGWLRKACTFDSVPSCTVAGKALARGEGLEKDLDTAQRLLTPACERKDTVACFELGLLEYGRQRFGPAADAWSRACDLGELTSCSNQAIALTQSGEKGHEGTIRARLKLACPSVPSACSDLAWDLLEDDAPAAFQAARQGCEQNDPASCWAQARFFAQGTGTEKDLAQARTFHERACTLGEVRGCNSLAVFLQRGLGGDRDLPRAAKLLEDACATGDALSCANLGVTLWEGEGIAQDPDRARTLLADSCAAGVDVGCGGLADALSIAEFPSHKPVFEKACAAQVASGCLSLGAILEDHERDWAGAARRYLQACDLGDASGCLWYGEALREGKGVEKDAQKAAEYLQRACQGGDERACRK